MAIELDKITHATYSLILDGNGGEEQMLITMHSCQSGALSFRLTYASVDTCKAPDTEAIVIVPRTLTSEQVLAKLLTKIGDWFEKGLPCNLARITKDRRRVAIQLRKFLFV